MMPNKLPEPIPLALATAKMEPLIALHRHFMAANKMRILFEQAVADPQKWNRFPDAAPLEKFMLMHADDYGIFMFYWYSGLYVVIEGFQELKLKDQKIESLLQSPNTDALRLIRNATFHFQKEFFSPKMASFMASKDSVPWVFALTEAFSGFFLTEMPKLTQNEKKA